MPGRECYHCKQWIDQGEAHDCWTTTETALTQDLSEDLQEAWSSCYCFVRPKPRCLEVCLFLGRTLTAPQVRRAVPASKTRIAHLLQIRHRDEVEAPFTLWLREAYERADPAAVAGAPVRRGKPAPPPKAARATRASAAAKRR
jgi:hypothetical protein